MKILIQNCLTHRYLTSRSQWTADAGKAMTFATSEKAIVYCRKHHLAAVQIVLKFDTDQYDLSVPVTKECEQAAEPA